MASSGGSFTLGRRLDRELCGSDRVEVDGDSSSLVWGKFKMDGLGEASCLSTRELPESRWITRREWGGELSWSEVSHVEETEHVEDVEEVGEDRGSSAAAPDDEVRGGGGGDGLGGGFKLLPSSEGRRLNIELQQASSSSF